jgi:hypothetical protein
MLKSQSTADNMVFLRCYMHLSKEKNEVDMRFKHGLKGS